jgi:hypothetical protein
VPLPWGRAAACPGDRVRRPNPSPPFHPWAPSRSSSELAAPIAAAAAGERTAACKALAGIERRIAGIVKAIEDGAYSAALKERLAALERERDFAAVKLAATEPAPLHPILPALYRSKVEKLVATLSQSAVAAEAGEIIRSLIERFVLTPENGGLKSDSSAISLSRPVSCGHPVGKARAPDLSCNHRQAGFSLLRILVKSQSRPLGILPDGHRRPAIGSSARGQKYGPNYYLYLVGACGRDLVGLDVAIGNAKGAGPET